MNDNASFGLPPVPATPEQTIAALQAQIAALSAQLSALAPEQADPKEGTGALDSQGFPKEYVRLEIFPGRDAQDLAYVPIGIGGYAVKVTRGKEVILPKVFADVLAHAVENITTQSEGGLITRPALRFPFQVRGTATEEEFLAFRAQMAEQGKSAAVRT